MKITTKSIIALITTAGLVLQDPTVQNAVVAITLTHPHLAIIAAVIVAVAGVLHRPDVQAALEDAEDDANKGGGQKEDISK